MLDQPGLVFTYNQRERLYRKTNVSSKSPPLAIELEATERAVQWLASQNDTKITHAIILRDSQNLLLQ